MARDDTVSTGALVLLNSFSRAYRQGVEYVLPYLDHLGVPRHELDLASEPLPQNAGSYALIVVAHSELDRSGTRLGRAGRQRLLSAVGAGSGLLSFDPALPSAADLGEDAPAGPLGGEARLANDVSCSSVGAGHFITQRRGGLDVAPFLDALPVPGLAAPAETVLLRASESALLAATGLGKGRVARWATCKWADSRILGPLAGLDRPLWRSLVWAARKPFVMRALPPLVTMRVDDVAGTGGMWDRSPFYWVHGANQHGFKPWLGIYPYNLTPEAVGELRDLIDSGQATAFPHALGRPPRPGPFEDLFYWDDALEVRGGDADGFIYRAGGRPWTSDLDEFVFFDHHRGRPWSDAEAARGLASLDAWYGAHSPLPMSRYALAHFGEVGANAIGHIRERWGCDLIGQFIDVDTPLVLDSPWTIGGPFRRYEQPGTGAIMATRRGRRPVYYADFVNLAGHRFFNCVTEVRDVGGYEWFPDDDVPSTVRRGVRQLRRELDSMALAVLFTHETDRIYLIQPEEWPEKIGGVAEGIADYDPIYVTMDEGVSYVRATRTSQIRSCAYDASAEQVKVTLAGRADLDTHVMLFTEEGGKTVRRLVPVPAFEGQTTVAVSM